MNSLLGWFIKAMASWSTNNKKINIKKEKKKEWAIL